MIAPALAQRLKEESRSDHDSVDALVSSTKPFENQQQCLRFLQVQAAFHRVVDPIYHDDELNRSIPGLRDLARYGLVQQDLRTLGGVERDDITLPDTPQGPTAIGWLYCAEGSNMGAAFLLKDAKRSGFSEEHGASHLAGHPDGRGPHWRRFTAQLNELNLNEDEKNQAIEGAKEAFAFYKSVVRTVFPS